MELTPSSSADDIWTSLLILTSKRARPMEQGFDNDSDPSSMSSSKLKMYVLSNLLDCAVQCIPEQRKLYIQRIMTLPKPIQKTLMALIERRSKNSKSKTPKSALKKSSSSNGASSNKSRTTTPPRASSKSSREAGYKTPPRTGERSHDHHHSSSSGRHSSSPMYGSPMMDEGLLSPPPPPPPPPPQDGRASSSGHKSKSRSSSLKHPSPGYTPERKVARRNSSNSVGGPETNHHLGFLMSPGTMDSPQKIHSLVSDLRKRNEQLTSILDTYKKRQEELTSNMEAMEGKYRKDMMKVEASALDQQQELEQHYSAQLQSLQKQLQVARVEAAKNQNALEELQAARDQVELMQHKSHVLAETSEKLRKYKEKVSELQDVKEALQREQNAHAQSVDEIVRLEKELKSLQPIKHQVEDYKIRAIEAEVKLVECQDYLRRLEQQAGEQSLANEYLWQGAVSQKEQLEELQRRMQAENRAVKEGGVGEGVSELNPELYQELQRLRNENEQLREFADKRQGDSVQRLESDLDNSKQLSDRFKTEFLNTRNELSDTKTKLDETEKTCKALTSEVGTLKEQNDSNKRLADRYESEFLVTRTQLSETQDKLKEIQEKAEASAVKVEELTERSEKAERHGRVLQEKLDSCREELEQAKQSCLKYQEEIETWMKKAKEADEKAADRLVKWEKAQTEADETYAELDAAAQNVKRLQQDLDMFQQRANDLEELQQILERKLGEAEMDLTETRTQLSDAHLQCDDKEKQLKRLMEQKSKLQESFEAEKRARQKAAEEYRATLQNTRDSLNEKCRKEVQEIQGNMNMLLDNERKANKEKSRMVEHTKQSLNAKWMKDYEEMQERLSQSLKQARDESSERLDFLKQEHASEISRLQKEAQEERHNLIEKGKAMINEAQQKAKNEIDRESMKANDLEQRLRRIETEKEELENYLRQEVASLKDKLEFASRRIDDLNQETDDQQDTIKMLEREKYSLLEENERFRRQVGGHFGADGKTVAQLERLQKEYNAILQENENLKKNAHHSSRSTMSSISEESDSYSRGGGRSTISQLRRDFEQTIESLNNEKRQLIMLNTSAEAETRKAEKLAWEKEDEMKRLKEEMTSLKLQLARAEYAREEALDAQRAESKTAEDLSFFSANEDSKSPLVSTENARPSTPARENSFDRDRTPRASSRSPSLDRAMKQRDEHEMALRNRLSSLRSGTPPRVPANIHSTMRSPENRLVPPSNQKVLSPTRKHEQDANQQPSQSRRRRSFTPPSMLRKDQYHGENRKERRAESLSPTRKQEYQKGYEQGLMYMSSGSSISSVGKPRNTPTRSHTKLSAEAYGLTMSSSSGSLRSARSASSSGNSNARPIHDLPSLMDYDRAKARNAAAAGGHEGKPECQQS